MSCAPSESPNKAQLRLRCRNLTNLPSQENIEKIGKARTVVRQMKTLGKAKKLVKAEAKLAKLKAKEVGYTLGLRFDF